MNYVNPCPIETLGCKLQRSLTKPRGESRWNFQKDFLSPMELKTWETVSVELKFALKCWASTTTKYWMRRFKSLLVYLLNHKGWVRANCSHCSFVPNSREHFLMINILFLRMKYYTGPWLQHVYYLDIFLSRNSCRNAT